MPAGWGAVTEQLWNDPGALRVAAALMAMAVLALWGRVMALGAARRRLRDGVAQADRRASAADAARQDAQMQHGQMAVRLDERDGQLAAVTAERDGLVDALHGARMQAARLDRELAEARLAAAKDREAMAREAAELRAMREELSQTFKLLSQDALRRQGADLQRAHHDQLSSLLAPFRDQVHRFQTELQSRNKVLDEEGARLREQIALLHRRSEDISREAVALTRALKGDKQRQGAWGEMILERLLEESGLREGTHYRLQSSFTDGEGKTWRPDVVVHMPRRKLLVIDSKVSLVDYERAVNADDPETGATALRRHIAALRAHITALATKGYQRMDDASVDYVLMFIPIEGAFSEALRHDPELAGFALDKGVGLATPTTLMLTLRTVDHIWAVERRETNAMEIAGRAGQLYDKFVGVVESIDAVGKAIDTAGKAHHQAMDRLTRGPGNVVRQVEMLRTLGARAQKRLALDHDDDGSAAGDGPPRPPPTPAALAGQR